MAEDLSRLRRPDPPADRFEQDLAAGRRPRIEELLGAAAASLRPALLRQLVALEAGYRRRSGEAVRPEDYAGRFPELARAELDALLAPVGAAETRAPAADSRSAADPAAETDAGSGDRPPAAEPPLDPLATTAPDPDAGPDEAGGPGAVGRYRLLRRLGGGAFGEVFEAADPELGRRVAVKLPKPGRPLGPADVERFRHEGRQLAALKHPGLVAVYDAGLTPDGRPYVVSELVDGESLEDRLRREGRLPPAEAARLVAGAAEALAAAHAAGVVHRDVKPANLLLDPRGEVLVADFGLALPEDRAERAKGEYSGSPAYMAPEQHAGDAHLLDGRADVWALGVVFYECLTGRRPFPAQSLSGLKEEVERRDPKPLRQHDPALPEPLEKVVRRCLAKRPADRYDSAHDLAAALRSWFAGRPGRAARSAPRPAAAVRLRRRRVAAGAAALVATAAGLAELWDVFAGRRGGREEGTAAAAAGLPAGTSSTASPGDTAGTPTSPAASEAPPAPVASAEPLSVRVTNPAVPGRAGRPVTEPGVLPLVPGDEVTVEVAWPEPRYLYVVWVGSDQGPVPVYPWRDYDWAARPAAAPPRRDLTLPVGVINPTPAAETVLAIATEEPLPPGIDLRDLLRDLPHPAFSARPAAGRTRGSGGSEGGLRGLTAGSRGLTPHARPTPPEMSELSAFLHDRLDPLGAEFRVLSFPSGG